MGVILKKQKVAKYMERQKNIGIELLRIVAMLMIVFLHLVCHTFGDGSNGAMNSTIFSHHFLRALVLVCVECYAMITGYVMINSHPRLSRMLEIWLMVMFYSVGICILFYCCGMEVDRHMWIRNFHPITSKCYWYLTAYFGLYVLLPFVNPTLRTMSKKSILCCSSILFLFFSILPLLDVDLFGINAGYSSLWLLVCYIWGATIRRSIDEKWFSIRIRYLLGGFVIVIVMFITNASIETFYPEFATTKLYILLRQFPREYFSPLTVLYAFVLFLFFERIQIKKDSWRKIILFFSPLTLGVYLIHCHRLIWYNFIFRQDNKFAISEYSWWGYTGRVLFIGGVIFLFASLIEFSRLKLFELLRIKKICFRICERIDFWGRDDKI